MSFGFPGLECEAMIMASDHYCSSTLGDEQSIASVSEEKASGCSRENSGGGDSFYLLWVSSYKY